MPDTGAPHFIPFADPTDLVRDWPALSEDVAEQVALGLDAAGNAGIGSNVVQTVKTDVFSASVARGDFSGDVTGLTVTITPSSATSKVLVLVTISAGRTFPDGAPVAVTLFRDSSASTFIGDADGSRQRISTPTGSVAETGGANAAIQFLDSPETTSPVVYSLRLSHNSVSTLTLFVNRSDNDADSDQRMRSASSITAIEVAA